MSRVTTVQGVSQLIELGISVANVRKNFALISYVYWVVFVNSIFILYLLGFPEFYKQIFFSFLEYQFFFLPIFL